MQRLNLLVAIVIVLALGSVLAFAYMELKQRNEPKLKVATTTSLYDTGLLDFIGSYYENKYDTKLIFNPLGTGQAIAYARMGEADVLLVHSPSQELSFMKDNFGVARKIIAYNFFAIIGPPGDPDNIDGLTPLDTLKKIVELGRAGKASWVSRGDNSGTYTKENSLWTKDNFDISELRTETDWYIEAGAGMGQTLLVTNQRRAYTLTDMGTYLKYETEGAIDLTVYDNQGKDLLNVYSVYAVNPAKVAGVNFDNAVAFIKFLVSDEGQGIIGNFGISQVGQQLFYPAVKLLEENSDPQMAGLIRQYAFFDNYECPPAYRGGQDELYQ
jgi:tungstate transport system substrate-binding protein